MQHKRPSKFLIAVCAMSFPLMPSARAAQLSPQAPAVQNSRSGTARTLLNLDLSSKTASLSAAQILKNGGGRSIFINVGGKKESVGVGAAGLLTPAELLAAYQVSSTGQQSIILSCGGYATGGSFNLGAKFGQFVSSLSIPQGVTAYQTSARNLSLVGNLTNAGSIYAFSKAGLAGNISAQNILNQSTGSISTVLPHATLFSNQTAAHTDLNLSATNNISNFGLIASSGKLTITAAGGISNASQSGPPKSAVALIKSAGDLVLNSNKISNSGTVLSQSGNLKLQAVSSDAFEVDASSGTFSALSGNIAISSQANASSGIVLNGGNYLSSALNIDAAKGTVRGSLQAVSGVVNISACGADFGAATPDLRFGNLNVSGDPTYFNTAGTLHLGSVSATGGADLALIASQDVIVDGGTIDTTNQTDGTNSNRSVNDGGNITIIAGANVTPSPANIVSALVGDSTTVLNIGPGSSITGGAIDLSGVSSINSNGTLTLNGAGGNGGNILMLAFSGLGVGSTHTPGSINLGSSGSINSYGTASNATGFSGTISTNGNVTIIAGATSDPAGGAAITIPAIFAGASSSYSDQGSGGGNVSIMNSTPVITGNSLQIKNGSILGTVNYASLPTISISNGSASTISVGATQSNASIKIGALGGLSTLAVSNSSAWQTAIANFVIATLNTSRANFHPTGSETGNSANLKTNTVLQNAAMAEAEYLAATNSFAHFNLQGSGPTERVAILGTDTNASFCCAENIGFSSTQGQTPASEIISINNSMIAEADVRGTHAWNIYNSTFVGIGYANNGTFAYIVEDFSLNNTAPTAKTVASFPVYGGVAGAAGLLAVTPTAGPINEPLNPTSTAASAVFGNVLLPTSIIAGATHGTTNVNIIGGNTVTIAGSVLSNGLAALREDNNGVSGAPGGNISISSGGNISIFNIQATGGAGGSAANGAVTGGTGGAGGVISLSSSNGNISISPGAPCSPCIGIAAAGGNGGWALNPSNSGGAGGAGGNISLLAPNGSISISAIEAGGGGGSGGANGLGASNGGSGGAGGAGGAIQINAQTVNVQFYIDASGGGGGGAGGRGTDGGGGGGGGSFAMAGFGGSSIGRGGGGGGGGGQASGLGGGSAVTEFFLVNSSNGSAGTGSFAGGAGGGFALGGGGGLSFSDDGGAGGAAGAGGSSDNLGLSAGGVAGSGGSITIQGQTVQIQSTVGGVWTSFKPFSGTALSVGFKNDSLIALGPHSSGSTGTISISTTASSNAVSPLYSANADYTDTSAADKVPVVFTGTPFVVGVDPVSTNNGTFGNIESGSQANAITINGTSSNSPLSSGQFSNPGSIGQVTIVEGGIPAIFTSASTATPAELVAITQVSANGNTGTQTLTLDSSGAPLGGATFTIASNNIPIGGFTKLLLPAGVTATDNASLLTYSTSAQVDGALLVSGNSGTATIATPALLVNGSITDSRASGNLIIQGTGTNNSLSLGFATGASISSQNGSVSFNGNAAGPVTSNTVALGLIAASSNSSLVTFNGGNAAVNVSVSSITGALTGSGSPFVVSVSSGALTIGNIGSSANGAVQLSAETNIGGSGVIAGSSVSLQSISGDFGTSTAGLMVSTPSLSVNTGGSAYINSSAAINVSNSAVGSAFALTSTG